MSALEFNFRRQPEREQWSGRWVRGIELEDQRISERAAKQRKNNKQASRRAIEIHRHPSGRLLAAWTPVQAALRAELDESVFNMWIAHLHPHSLVGGVWTLAAPRIAASWIEDRFGRVVEACAGRPCVYVICGGAA
jgi:hypothetical protein